MIEADRLLERWRAQIDADLAAALPPPDGVVAPLPEAMRYAALAPGKRLRPLLALGACCAAGGAVADAIPCALAVELIHAYSLIHDDLPAMDDDALRRGRPTAHVRFGEATAILAGDALQAHAFVVLAGASLPAERIAAQARTLARAAGVDGMAGGQQLDLLGEGRPVDESLVLEISRRKTAALIAAACRIGAEAAGAAPEASDRLETIGAAVGLAYQIQDDLLDQTATTAQLGKTAGKDASASKQTWPAALGAEESRQRAGALLAQALTAIAEFGAAGAPLAAVVRRVAERAS